VAPVLVTLHRPSNTDDPVQLQRLFDAIARIARPVLWPMHPRTRDAMAQHGVRLPEHVHMVAPLGYTALVQALASAHAVVTDSGGLQKEAYWLGTPCLTVRPDTEWMETVHSGWNRLVDVRTGDLAELVESVSRPAGARDAYGAAGAADRVVRAIEQRFEGRARAAA
jgi:UDP-N-acetylglucosamine 2-epimerase